MFFKKQSNIISFDTLLKNSAMFYDKDILLYATVLGTWQLMAILWTFP